MSRPMFFLSIRYKLEESRGRHWLASFNLQVPGRDQAMMYRVKPIPGTRYFVYHGKNHRPLVRNTSFLKRGCAVLRGLSATFFFLAREFSFVCETLSVYPPPGVFFVFARSFSVALESLSITTLH